jgi:TPR repeat protein
VDPAKAQAAKDQATRKTIEFQKRRAEEGSSTAQYDLGIRYIKGDGVERDEAKGRVLLEASAKNGFNPAVKKLSELTKPDQVKK